MIYVAFGVPFAVSIHAPARGATRRPKASFHTIVWFQFTRPQGARHGDAIGQHNSNCFNSRARKGRDIKMEMIIIKN